MLFIYDLRFNCFNALRSKVSFIGVSVQQVVNLPSKLLHTLSNNFVSKQIILAENARLKSELLLTNVKLQRLDYLEYENAQLHLLLNYSKQIKNRVLAAQLLLSTVDLYGQQVTIDKGKQQGVYVGQPVLDAYGLLGQVVAVAADVGKVLLITNRKSAIPVMITRNGVRAIAVGVGDGSNLELVHVSETADVKVGDVLVTSGLEKRFPSGYQVGVIKEVKHIIGERFVKIFVTPAAHINNYNLHVLLIWSDLVDKAKPNNRTLKNS